MSGFGKAGGFGGGNRRKTSKSEKTIPYKNPHPDPFADLPEAENLEEASKDEAKAIADAYAGFKKRTEKERQRFEFAVDADFWCGLCFRTRADRNKFLEAVGVNRLYNSQHIDGYELSKLLGLDIEFEDQ